MTNTQRENWNSKAKPDTASRGTGSIAANRIKGELDAASERLKGRDPDDLPNIEAEKEAVRQHRDAFIVKSDLEDADEREATPGTREQP